VLTVPLRSCADIKDAKRITNEILLDSIVSVKMSDAIAL
jgi:hypothetical protein